jgi:hypothetical protein
LGSFAAPSAAAPTLPSIAATRLRERRPATWLGTCFSLMRSIAVIRQAVGSTRGVAADQAELSPLCM